MPFTKGKSGNVRGRPVQTDEQRQQREQFKALLSANTVNALKNIILIASDRKHKDCYKANTFLIDKAYGVNTAFLLDSTEENAPVIIKVVPYGKSTDEEDWEREWNETPDENEIEEDEDDE